METTELRKLTMELMKQQYMFNWTQEHYPLVDGYTRKLKEHTQILTWDEVIDWMNGGITERGIPRYYKIGPTESVIERNFRIYIIMYLNKNNINTDRIATQIEIRNNDTEWTKQKDFGWHQDENVAIAYYGLQMLIHEKCEQALEKHKTTLKMTPKLESEIIEIINLAF
jgi:hypothetical protein